MSAAWLLRLLVDQEEASVALQCCKTDSIVMSPAVAKMDLFDNIGQISNIIKDFYHSDAVVHYKFSGERLIPHPYDVTITSRVSNIWAFVVTALVVLLAIGCLFYRRIRKLIF